MFIKYVSKSFVSVFASLVIAFNASSTVIEVNPGDPSWGTFDPNSEITDGLARNGNGSIELRGDRTRFYGLGNPFDPSSNLGLLSSLTDFSFEWAIDSTSVSLLGADYTPALRLHIFDGQQRSELIWEGAYNGTYGSTARNTWYQTAFSDNFWRFETGIGDSLIYNRSITDWVNTGYSSQAYIAGVSVGVGSSVGAGYLGYADTITMQFAGAAPVTFNFEPIVEEVSEPAIVWLVLMLSSLLVLKRNRR